MEKILKGYVFCMYLTDKQKILIEKSMGSSRFIYNYFLNISKETKIYRRTRFLLIFECKNKIGWRPSKAGLWRIRSIQ